MSADASEEPCSVCHDRPGQKGKCHPLCSECEDKLERPCCPVCRKRLRVVQMDTVMEAAMKAARDAKTNRAAAAAEKTLAREAERQADEIDDAIDDAVAQEASAVVFLGGPAHVAAKGLLARNADAWVRAVRARGMHGAGCYRVFCARVDEGGVKFDVSGSASTFVTNLDDPRRAPLTPGVFAGYVDGARVQLCYVLQSTWLEHHQLKCTVVRYNGEYSEWKVIRRPGAPRVHRFEDGRVEIGSSSSESDSDSE